MINTNKIKVEFDKKSIDRDFSIYKIYNEEKNIFYKTNVLDIAKEEFKAISVVYTWGQTSYVMFNKEQVDRDRLREAINRENINMQVQKIDILNEHIYDNILTMLMLNSLNILKTDGEYSNLTGKLYLTNKDWFKKDKEKKISGFYTLEVKLSLEMELNLKVTTFGRFDYFKNNKASAIKKYVFDKKTYQIRRKLKIDNVKDEEIFIQRSIYSKKRNIVPFLDFKSYEDYKRCKIGMLDSLLQDVDDYLGSYIKIKNCEIEDCSKYEIENNNFENRDYKNLLKGKKIIIIDEVKSYESEKLIKLFAKIVSNNFNLSIEKSEDIDFKKYNLKIIHEAEYYKVNNLEDPYKCEDIDCVIQHITLESFIKDLNKDKIDNAAMTKIIQELIIKEDILNKKISIVDWEKYDYKEKWTFLKRKQIQIDKKNYKYIYCKMTIGKDGILDINIYDNSVDNFVDNKDVWEWNAIVNAYGEEFKYKKDDALEGIFYKDYENINRIYKTDRSTVPNFRELRELLKKSNKSEKISVFNIINVLGNFDSQDEKVIEHKETFINALKEFSEYETIRKINKEMKIKSNGGKAINKYILNELGILINPQLKTGNRKFELFKSMMDINYYTKDDDIYYFVGVSSDKINQSFRNACVIRKVVADNENEFKNIINLLAVEFVKNGQYTVIPFPFKYINEILNKYTK